MAGFVTGQFGWAVRVGEGQSLILKTSVLKTKESGGKGGKALRCLLFFLASVLVAQIFLVLKKKQFEKVHALLALAD